jgi:tetratricopeptide (TPR) repeat protein
VEVSHAFSGKPENENALAVLGHIALCEGKEYEAVRHLRDSKNPADLALKGLVTNNIASSLASVNSARSERGCDNRLLLELSGTLFFLQGNIEEARRCFERLMEISSVPTLDWSIYLILENSLGKKSETLVTLRSKCANYPTELWASRLIDLAAGEITIETLVESVQNDEPGFRLQRQGEAYYVASEIALARSDKEAAANYFALATENCVRSSLAYNFARCRLQQIKSGTGKRVD